jgi:hypothetical protein
MKKKLLTLALGLLSVIISKAGTGDDPGTGTGKKDELNGTVVHADNKKPLKDVTITAYLISKKERVEMTGDDGDFSFDELKPGVYKFIFEKAGFRKVTKEKVVIKTDEAFRMNIEMIENSDYEIMPSPFQVSGGF